MSIKIGFIGLGYMGTAVARTLLKMGFDLTVFDLRPEAVENLVHRGAHAAGSAREVAQNAECVFTMVLNDAQTETVVLGEDGVLAGMTRGKGVISVMSTVSPLLIRKLSETAMAEKGIPVLDTPVSGVPGAAAR